jgi:hypothetical protein
MYSTKDSAPKPTAASSSFTDCNVAPTNNVNDSIGFKHRLRLIFTHPSKDSDTHLAPYQELIINQKVFHRSVNCLRFAVFVDAIAGAIEQPNYRELITFLN